MSKLILDYEKKQGVIIISGKIIQFMVFRSELQITYYYNKYYKDFKEVEVRRK